MFWRVIGHLDSADFQVCDFCLFSCRFLMILMFWEGLKGWEFDSRWAFQDKVDSQDQARSRCHFGGSPRTKIMKFHQFILYWFSLWILIILVFWKVILGASLGKIVKKPLHVFKKYLHKTDLKIMASRSELDPYVNVHQRSKVYHFPCVFEHVCFSKA